MQVRDSFDPVVRLIQMHELSLSRAARRREAAQARRVQCDQAPTGCRSALATANRKISLLRRRLLTAREQAFVQIRSLRPVEETARASDAWLAAQQAASRSGCPMPYAPAPLGRPTEFRDATPPDPAAIVHVINWFHVTNLGTLLDVLA